MLAVDGVHQLTPRVDMVMRVKGMRWEMDSILNPKDWDVKSYKIEWFIERLKDRVSWEK